MEQWRPTKCPKDEGVMGSIAGFSGAWKCAVCGLEIWDGDVPTSEEYEELVLLDRSASSPEFISRSYVPGTVRPGGSKSGRRWKKKKKVDLQNRYRMLERS
jgi:hypothetical protein